MSFDPLLIALGLTALATPTVLTTFGPTATRAAVRVESAVLPSNPGIGDIAVDSGDSNKLKWYNGSGWQAAGGSGSGTPAGSDTELQYNSAGAFGASSDLAFTTGQGLYVKRLLMPAAGRTAFRVDNTIAGSGVSAGTSTAASILMQRIVAVGETATVHMRGLYVESRYLGSNTASTGANVTSLAWLSENGSDAAGVVASVVGMSGSVVTNSGSVTNLVTGYSVYFGAGGTSTAFRGVSIEGAGSGAVTSVYGVYLDVSVFSTVTNRWGIYQVGVNTTNYWQGINRFVPRTLPVGVAGDIVVDGDDANKLKWYNGTSWVTAGGGASPSQQNLTDAATVSYNASSATGFSLTLTSGVGSSRLLDTPTGLTPGMSWTIRVVQAVGGGLNLTFSAAYVFSYAVTPTVTPAANAVDVIHCYYDGVSILTNIEHSLGTSGQLVLVADRLNISGAVNEGITTVITDTNLGVDHNIIMVDASAGPVVLYLPDTSGSGVISRRYVVIKTDASANVVRVRATGSDTVNGDSEILLTMIYQTLTFRAASLLWVAV